jgi:signal transduction histidine kinase
MADADFLNGVLNNIPSALISLDEKHTVVHRNQPGERLTPQLKPGVNIWDALKGVVNEEKIDRMMRGERVLFRAEAATVIRQNAQHLQTMVDDIVDLSRNSFGELKPDLTPVDLAHLIEVRLSESGEGALIEVEDDGGGILFEDPEDAFGSFRSGPTVDEVAIPGSGNGLTISREQARTAISPAPT